MKMKYVIVVALFFAILGLGTKVCSQTADLKSKYDSLFMMASSGSITFKDMVEPAKDSIAAMGKPVVPLLIDEFSTRSARARWAVVHILERIGSEAVPDLVAAMSRPEGLIVQRICLALGNIKDSAAVQPLIDIRRHSRWQVRDQALGALGKIGHHQATSAVIEALADSIGQVRKAAAVACGRLKLEEAANLLVHQLGDDFYGARMSALHALMAFDTSLVIEVIADSLESANHFVGDLGCFVLGEYGTEAAIDLLFARSMVDDPDRRAHAVVALLKADPDDLCGYHHQLFDSETDRLVLLKMNSMISSKTDEKQ